MICSYKYWLFLILSAVILVANARPALTKGDIIVKTAKSPHKGRVVLKEIENLRDDTVILCIINEYEKPGKRESFKELKPKQKANWDVTFNIIKGGLKKDETNVEIFRYERAGIRNDSNIILKENNQDNPDTEKISDIRELTLSGNNQLVNNFNKYLRSIPFFSASRYTSDSLIISGHLDNLNLSSINKSAYIEECVDGYLTEYKDSLNKYINDSTLIVTKYIEGLSELNVKDLHRDSLMACYSEVILLKANQIEPLIKNISEKRVWNTDDWDLKFIVVCSSLILLCSGLGVWYWRANKKTLKRKKKRLETTQEDEKKPSLVVVGAKTLTPLKKQNLDDVYDNSEYLEINTSDFCDKSLVNRIFIKNSCIIDIYNMYADDLRTPDNPKEDGCMVLGRWVLDEETGKYDISLEHIVLPGDDAVFTEYELNFGGKIKLRMSEKLRKLRKESGMQYDLTCWVHSHPGLGVFFSSSDNNVHHQLKHPIHPGFLTAFVIDILTPSQDLGIFTFREQDNLNSKNDLKRLFSLEEMYKNALHNNRKSFDASNYFNLLYDARNHYDFCSGIFLHNSAIIDMTFLTSKQNGFIGFTHGYQTERGGKMDFIVSAINEKEEFPNTDKIGCFIITTHCSIPSIRKILSSHLKDIKFVIVYTSSNGLITAIPVSDKNLSSNDTYYGEQDLDNLKIWTRRRR